MHPFLLVYGTLMNGVNTKKNQFLSDHAIFLGQATVPGRLYDLGAYPGLVYDETADTSVTGHLFEVKAPELVFATLDLFEGIDPSSPRSGQYIRGLITVVHQGKDLQCWTYLYNWTTEGLPVIASGNYLDYFRHNARHQQFIKTN